MSKHPRRSLLIALAALAVAAIVILGRDALLKRLPHAGDARPRELVAGVKGIQQPRATPEQERINAIALKSAADYAASHESHALIVTRHGHLVFEQYWKGSASDTVVDAGAFARTVAAMAVGAAIDDGRIASIDDVVPSHAAAPVGGAGTATIRQVLESDDVQPLAQLIEQATGRRYAAFVSRKIWRRLSAGDAWVVLDKPAGVARLDCCFFARQGDWMRIAQLLLNDGVYQGSRILPRGWAEQMAAPSRRDPAAGFQLQLGIPRDGFYLAGEGKNRLWLIPSLNVAILRLGAEPMDWDEGRIPGLIVAGIEDRPAPAQSTETDLSKLVPHH